MKRSLYLSVFLLGVVIVYTTSACGPPQTAVQATATQTGPPVATATGTQRGTSIPTTGVPASAIPAVTASSAATGSGPERTYLPAIQTEAIFTPTPTPTRTRTPAATATPTSPPSDPRYYNIGTPTLQNIWVDPLHGNDGNSGAVREQALRTVTAAWERIPMSTPLSSGYRIMLAAGVYPEDIVPVYWESRFGTFAAPIIIQSADGPGAAILPGLSFANVRYLYLIGLHMRAGADDVLHCERCDHFLVRQCQVEGTGDPATYNSPQEALKVNQSRYVYVEDSDLSGAYGNAVDFVAVQNGHLQGNRVHNALDWCAYVKGGSAYIRVEGNEFYGCGAGGFSAGQGTGFEYMVSPWLHYEAYDIKIINNVVHDTTGAGLGVNGGYDILIAYNTLYRVGEASHVLEFVHGHRSCDGNTDACQSNLNAGGWGTTGEGGQWIPNRNIYVYNNVVYNPAPYQSQWTQFSIQGAETPPPGSHIPSPSLADDHLVIAGNIIWNGPPSHPLGVEDSSNGCQPANPTCNATQLAGRNAINRIEPQLVNPAAGDFRPAPGGNLFSATTYAIPDFTWSDAPTQPPAPAGNLSNSVPRDRNGASRSSTTPPGAYVR